MEISSASLPITKYIWSHQEKRRKLDNDSKKKFAYESTHNLDVKNEVVTIIFITPYQSGHRGGRLSAEGSQGVTVGWLLAWVQLVAGAVLPHSPKCIQSDVILSPGIVFISSGY